MKQDTNNQIDLLLRRLGGRDGAATSRATADDRHLDADELSSYAQNALPAAARARYTEHLADCTTCRKLVTELSLSLGTVAVGAPVEVVPVAGGLKTFLASLFSPLVLRYAVPALGVIVVMIVGLVILRQQTQPELVATKNGPLQQSEPAAASPAQGFQDSEARTPENEVSSEPKAPELKPKGGAGAGAPAGSATAAAPVPATKDERQVAELQPTVTPAATPPAAAAKAAAPATVEAQTADTATKKPAEVKAKLDDETAKERAANEPAREPVRITPQATTERKEQEKDKPKTAQPETSGFLAGAASVSGSRSATRRTAAAKREDTDRGQADTANAETRTIAGRRFRKARGIWIDTAYDSSTATVNMARDSEQFRALIADEPAIGTIAKQLDGEVIVVWKGRAYRIR